MAATAIDLQSYAALDDEDCGQRVMRATAAPGDWVVTLGSRHQRDEIFQHADFSGDSLIPSRPAADSRGRADRVLGVHFMVALATNVHVALQRCSIFNLMKPVSGISSVSIDG